MASSSQTTSQSHDADAYVTEFKEFRYTRILSSDIVKQQHKLLLRNHTEESEFEEWTQAVIKRWAGNETNPIRPPVAKVLYNFGMTLIDTIPTLPSFNRFDHKVYLAQGIMDCIEAKVPGYFLPNSEPRQMRVKLEETFHTDDHMRLRVVMEILRKAKLTNLQQTIDMKHHDYHYGIQCKLFGERDTLKSHQTNTEISLAPLRSLPYVGKKLDTWNDYQSFEKLVDESYPYEGLFCDSLDSYGCSSGTMQVKDYDVNLLKCKYKSWTAKTPAMYYDLTSPPGYSRIE